MKKRFKFLTVILVVVLMLSLSATVAAADNLTADFTDDYYGYYGDGYVYIYYKPGEENRTNAVGYTAVNVQDAEDGLAVTTLTAVNNQKSTIQGTTVVGNYVNSGLAGVAGQIYAKEMFHFGQRLYNGTLYSWSIPVE